MVSSVVSRLPLSLALCICTLVPIWSEAQTDLDAFMRQVLARRDDNWKKLQQYILDERCAGRGGPPARAPRRGGGCGAPVPPRREEELRKRPERHPRGGVGGGAGGPPPPPGGGRGPRAGPPGPR